MRLQQAVLRSKYSQQNVAFCHAHIIKLRDEKFMKNDYEFLSRIVRLL